jgi:hypothetical protein
MALGEFCNQKIFTFIGVTYRVHFSMWQRIFFSSPYVYIS